MVLSWCDVDRVKTKAGRGSKVDKDSAKDNGYAPEWFVIEVNTTGLGYIFLSNKTV